jgi:protein phosphatase
MGAMLPKPVTSTLIHRGGDKNLNYAVSSINGYRKSMEDSHSCYIGTNYFFGVFDGHANDKASQYFSELLPKELLAENSFPIPKENIVKKCFELDEKFREDFENGGTTATFAIVGRMPNNKYLAQICNIGDSRIMILRKKINSETGGISFDKIYVTATRKPNDLDEKMRIEKAGGYVRMNRVDGDLAVSRAFGDHMYKRNTQNLERNKVIPLPDIDEIELEVGDLLVGFCDGLYEGEFSDDQITEFISEALVKERDLGTITSLLCQQGLKTGSKDNISVMIIQFDSPFIGEFLAQEFIPGAPYLKMHDGSKIAYREMAYRAGKSLSDAIKMRYELLHAYTNGTLLTDPVWTSAQRTAFLLYNTDDIEEEIKFFGEVPPIPPSSILEIKTKMVKATEMLVEVSSPEASEEIIEVSRQINEMAHLVLEISRAQKEYDDYFLRLVGDA